MPDGNVVCTYTNTRVNRNLTLVKQWVNGAVGDQISVTTQSSGNNATVGSTSTGNNQTTGSAASVVPGTVVTLPAETFGVGTQANYTTTVSCTGVTLPPPGVPGASFTMPDGEVTCTYTNTRRSATLQLRKTWTNAVVNDTASLSAAGLANSATLALLSTANTANETDPGASATVYAGEVATISETVNSPSNATYSSNLVCVGNFNTLVGNQLTVSGDDDGATIVCTWTNGRTTPPFPGGGANPVPVNGPAGLALLMAVLYLLLPLPVGLAYGRMRLEREAYDWALAFCARGGDSLSAYPEYHRIAQDAQGTWRVSNREVAKRHRLQVGTIVAEASMRVKWLSGGTIGTIEEGFIARLKKGDCFVFAGRFLEYVRTQELTAYVRKATRPKGVVPSWAGSKMPLSSELADAVLAMLDGAAQGDFFDPEMQAAMPMLKAQMQRSVLPRTGRLLVETWRSREGHHLFLYPFGGRNVHIGLAQLLAWRLAREQPNTYSLSVNDYGLEILAAKPMELASLDDGSLFSAEALLLDVLASLNSGELAQRRFREIARVAGLVFGGYPGAPKSARQLQASSSLFFEVFRKYDSGNRLLTQAENEVLAQELDIARLRAVLKRLARAPMDRVALQAPSPFALPLLVERLREQLTTEKLKDRLDRLLAQAEEGLDA
jgi:hypothetical protein